MKFVGINTIRASNGRLKQYILSDKGTVLFRWLYGEGWGDWELESKVESFLDKDGNEVSI